jgi:hypothetical protein
MDPDKYQMRAQDFVFEAQDYMQGHCHVMALALASLNPSWRLRAHIGWEEDAESDEDYVIDHVYAVAEDGTAWDCRGQFPTEQALVGPDETGGVETQFVDFDAEDIRSAVSRGLLKPYTPKDVDSAVRVAQEWLR